MEKIQGVWETTITAPTFSGVLYYCFEIHLPEKKYYYGAGENGKGVLSPEPAKGFQLTIYEEGFTTPDWAKNAAMYQIFPDRFRLGSPGKIAEVLSYRKKMKRNTLLHQEWGEEVLYRPLKGETDYIPCDFYGGDFAGIEAALPELADLGVTVLYLNPIGEAASNHRYDTADYFTPDPFLGDIADFIRLAETAKKYHIRIILDGVYSHTGADSKYFNKSGTYPQKGAYQGKDSPYYHWYSFGEDRDDYKSWWNFKTLPEVNETRPEWEQFVITGENSVIHTWLNYGASGFRLDVADELPDETIAAIRTVMKQKDEENFLIGEVWEDAVTKKSYGKNRKYALGGGLDSVMNYPFRNACIDFLLGKGDAERLSEFFCRQQRNYPLQMYYTLMNLLSSHDVPRIRTVLALKGEHSEWNREKQATITDDSVPEEMDREGACLQRLACLLSYAVPGIPAIYYGDEYGLHGMRDPFNRRTFWRRDQELCSFYRKFLRLRNQNAVFHTGFAQFVAASADVIAIHRFFIAGKDAFGQQRQGTDFLVLINRGEATKVEVPFLLQSTGIEKEMWDMVIDKAYITAVDIVDGTCISVENQQISISMPAKSYRVLRLQEEKTEN